MKIREKKRKPVPAETAVRFASLSSALLTVLNGFFIELTLTDTGDIVVASVQIYAIQGHVYVTITSIYSHEKAAAVQLNMGAYDNINNTLL